MHDFSFLWYIRVTEMILMVHVVNRREKKAKRNEKKAQKAVNGKEPSILCAKALSSFLQREKNYIYIKKWLRLGCKNESYFFFPIISLTLNWLFLCLCCCSFPPHRIHTKSRKTFFFSLNLLKWVSFLSIQVCKYE